MSRSDISPQAIADAREAVAAEITYRLDEIPAREIVRIAVEGAAPAIRAAEWEACAQLADDLGATYPVTCTMADCPCPPGESVHTRPFGDLLREIQP